MKKYRAEQISNLSWTEWNMLMAKELNEKGFTARGLEGRPVPYDGSFDCDLFILGEVRDEPEINYLKDIGLLNNGRCPLCGRQIKGSPGRFTSGFNHNIHFNICRDCASVGQQKSVNPENSGCVVALLLMPIFTLKAIFSIF